MNVYTCKREIVNDDDFKCFMNNKKESAFHLFGENVVINLSISIYT